MDIIGMIHKLNYVDAVEKNVINKKLMVFTLNRTGTGH